MKATAKAHTNIALIKYWGKRNEQLILPMNSSLSITLDKFQTTTTIHFNDELSSDLLTINNMKMNEAETIKVTNFLNIVRELARIKLFATVNSISNVPFAAGFASSASGYAALAAAATKALNLPINKKQLSQIARRGSGSACRSIYGGFVEWYKGELDDGSDSFAKPILNKNDWDISVLAVVLTADKKAVSSREGMRRTVNTSTFYEKWVLEAEADLIQLKKAIMNRNFTLLGEISEANALKMHATMLGAKPPFTYWQSSTVSVMEKVWELRQSGIEAYFTIDAGPNVKIICRHDDEQIIADEILTLNCVQKVYISRQGDGITYL